MPVGAGELREPVVVGRVDRTMRGLGPGDEIAHARVAPRRGNIERAHGLGPLPQAGGHRVEAEKQTGGGQGLGTTA